MADRHVGMTAHIKQHNLLMLLQRIKFQQPRSSDSAAMRFCLPLLAHAPRHHGLSRCIFTEELAGVLQRTFCHRRVAYVWKDIWDSFRAASAPAHRLRAMRCSALGLRSSAARV